MLEWAQQSGVMPNGLLPNAGPGPLNRVFDSERWLKAEERTAELIACIQLNQPSEERRNAVVDYVQRLIMKCFPCQVFTFGSLPLKTYLPNEVIDLTAFSNNPNLKDSWANEVRDMLENEVKNESAEFHVKEVQYIQAEVKIIKCLVENFVVDISFNQLGGLRTLCFLEEVDHIINQNHLFKRSIILIKAWCYYESRILGAHHGLISTYALETLVLYIFHVYNNSFAGPLEVLYRFLEFFSNFDWENFCVSLWGPVSISSLPDVIAEHPRQDSGVLLLSQVFLEWCSSVYGVSPTGQEDQGQPFVSEHFNVFDPLDINNNLGRSVSKANFYRIRSAFTFGAKKLARLLDCPEENIMFEVNHFFSNTWDRHGSGLRPDAPRTELLRSRLSTPDDPPFVTDVVIEYEYKYTGNSDPKQLKFGSMGREDFSGGMNEQSQILGQWSSLHVSRHNIPGHEPAQTSGSDPMGPGTRQRMMDNSSGGVLPFTFYPTGPLVPFVTMLPLYNMPPDTGTSDATTSHYGGKEGLNNTDPRQKFDSSKVPDQSEDLASVNTGYDERVSDILQSDFSWHRRNLQFGRFCQNPQSQGPMI